MVCINRSRPRPIDKSLLDLAFETQDKKIIEKILRSECANLHAVNKETSHSVLANILLQDKTADREELFQIIKDQLTTEDYCALLQASVTDLIPRLFDLGCGVNQETVQAMFEEAIISGYQKAALILFNQFPEIDLSFKADVGSDINTLENLIYRLHNYDLYSISDYNDDKAAIHDLLNLLLKQGDLSELDSNLLSELFSGSATSSDLELIKALLKNNTYTLEQDDVKEALDTIAGFEDIPATARILLRHVLKMWNKDNLDDLKLISRPLLNILSKMPEDKMREFLSLILQKDLVMQFVSIRDYHTLCTHLIEQHGKKGSTAKEQLEYAKIIMVHCFWRSELSSEKQNEEKFDREQVNVLWKKLRSTGDKDILKLALKSEVLNVDAVSLDDKNVFNLYGIVNLFKSSLNKDIAFFRAFSGYQDPEMIKGLIRNKGFKIESEAQFADELLRATDEIFHVSISELQKKGMLSEKLILVLMHKISAQSTPSYKKHEILFNINPELIKKALQKENKPLNLLELYKDGCSIDYIKEISSIKGLAIQQTDNNKNTLVHAAAACGVAEDVSKVLEFTEIEINTKNNQGFTPLMLLCASNAENKVAIADIIINHESFGWSKELRKTQSNHILLAYLADKDGFASSGIADYLLSIPEIATEKNIRDLLLVALADGKMNVIFPDNASIDSKLREVRNSKSFLQDSIASNNNEIQRQNIVGRLIDETTISQEELPSVMFDVYKRCISSSPSHNVDLESYKISSLMQIAEKLGTDMNVQRVERMVVPSEKQSELYVSTSILGLACAHGAESVVSALMKLKDIDLNCGTKASGEIPEMPPILMAYNALRNNQEEAKNATDITKDARDLNKPYIEIIKALLEKEGLDLTKEFAAGLGHISIAELLYSDPVLSMHESTRTIRKNIIDNICKSKGSSRIKDHLLMLASAAGDIASVQTLLDNEASPLAKNEYGCYSLAIAAINFAKNPEEYSKVIELLTSKVSIEAYKIKTNAGMNSALMITAYRNRDQKISNIEDTAAVLQNIKEKAEWKCDRQIVADLIRRGADPLFGQNSETFTSKMLLIMIKTSLFTLANHFLLKFNPVLQKVGSVGIAWNTATEVGSAVGDLVTNKVIEYVGKIK